MSAVGDFERAFGEYVGARYCIALCNGTATLHTALVAWKGVLGEQLKRVQVPPLTMSATTIAVLQAGLEVEFADVDPDTWIMRGDSSAHHITVSLYGLHTPWRGIIDAAQTLAAHSPLSAFTSYSFQASKILALGEGGMLATNDEGLATRAREFSSLGYRMWADSAAIPKRALKDPAFTRHHTYPAWNYRMAPALARMAMLHGEHESARSRWDDRKRDRHDCAALYRDAVAGCSWIRPQHTPEGWTHDAWSFAVALESADLWHPFADAIERHGGTRPFAAWRLTYQEPAFRHLAEDGCCPIAEDLQPRICAGQTNDLESAKRNAAAWECAIAELNGCPA